MKVYLNKVSGNSKTGPIPVTTSSKATCPDTCALKAKGCYARFHIMGKIWREVTEGTRGIDWKEFVREVRSFRRGQLWRHNQAGDLPGEGSEINAAELNELVAANKGKRGFTYTHKPLNVGMNEALIRKANKDGFTINTSNDNMA